MATGDAARTLLTASRCGQISNTEPLKEQTSGDKILAWCFACEMQTHFSTKYSGFPFHINRITQVVTIKLQKVESELSPCCIYPILKKQLVLTSVYQMSSSYFPLAKCTSCLGSKTVIRTPSVDWFLCHSRVTKMFRVKHQHHYLAKGMNIERQDRDRELNERSQGI